MLLTIDLAKSREVKLFTNPVNRFKNHTKEPKPIHKLSSFKYLTWIALVIVPSGFIFLLQGKTKAMYNKKNETAKVIVKRTKWIKEYVKP